MLLASAYYLDNFERSYHKTAGRRTVVLTEADMIFIVHFHISNHKGNLCVHNANMGLYYCSKLVGDRAPPPNSGTQLLGFPNQKKGHVAVDSSWSPDKQKSTKNKLYVCDPNNCAKNYRS